MDTLEILGTLFLILIGVGTIVLSGYGLSNSNLRSSILSVFSSFFFAVTNFIPFGLVTFGFIADMIGQEFRYSYASIVGLSAILINYFVGKLLGGSVSTGPEQPGTAWCMIPGLEWAENKFMPMNIVSSWAIISYFLIFSLVDRDASKSLSLGVSLGLIALTQIATFYFSDCSTFYEGASVFRFLAVLLGVIVGATGYGIISTALPSQAPFFSVTDYSNQAPATSSGWRNTAPTKTPGSQTSAQCSQQSSEQGDEFVCEAYKNGVLVTEQISK